VSLLRQDRDRLVILAPGDYACWLGGEPDPRDLMRPLPADDADVANFLPVRQARPLTDRRNGVEQLRYVVADASDNRLPEIALSPRRPPCCAQA